MAKIPKAVCLDIDQLEWLEAQVKSGNFESISEAIRKCVRAIMDHYDHFAYLLDL